MEFTKEQKEIIKEMYNLQLDGSDFEARIGKAFAEVLKPETKKIVVEIEYDDSKYGMSGKAIYQAVSNFDTRSEYVTKVTELPEVFSREDMIALGDKIVYNIQCNHQIYPYNEFGNNNLEFFLSEREK